MALALWVWIDTARVLKRGVVAIEEGEPTIAETFSDQFPCRLPPRSARQSFGERHHTTEDRREFTAMITAASDTLTEADRLEITTQEGETLIWEVEKVSRPRDGAGEILLLVCDVVRREDS